MSMRGTLKSKSKGVRSLFRNSFGQSSSQRTPPSPSPQPSKLLASVSRILPVEARAAKEEPGDQSTSPVLDQQITGVQPTFVPPVIGTEPPNPRFTLPPADASEEVGTTILNRAWVGLQRSLQTLKNTSGVFSPLASAVEVVLSCFDTIEAASRKQQDYEELATELTALSEALTQHFDMSISTPISKLGSSNKQRISVGSRVMAKERGYYSLEDTDDVIRHYRRIQSLFRQLQVNLGVSAWSIAHRHLVNARLEALDPKKQATYDSTLSASVNRRTCTEGTRKEVLLNLIDWINNSGASKVYWMNGMAGTGKTTVACTFAEWLERKKLLAACFFCTRAAADCKDVTRIVPTIAYQLARYSIPFQSALYEVLEEDPDIGLKNIPKQFERLLKEPMQNVKDSIPEGLVVVIDALDECEDRNGVEALLDELFRYISDIPLKFFFTSRPEQEIYNYMVTNARSRVAFHLHDIEASRVRSDIELYLKEELGSIYPTVAEVDLLSQRSGNLFIYAATLARYILFVQRFANPRQRLESVLMLTPESTKKYAELDALYTVILASALDEARMEVDEAENVKAVLRTVLFAQEPVTTSTIAVLAGLEDLERVSFALQPLRSVLHQSEENGLVLTFHASFPDIREHRTSNRGLRSALEIRTSNTDLQRSVETPNTRGVS